MDAPELEVEDYLIGGKKYRHSKELSEMTDEQKQEAAVMASVAAAESAMPYAMEWWDAELLPGKLRKELASEEGKAIASRAKKQASVSVDDTKKEEVIDSSTPQQKHSNFIERCYKHASLTNSKSHSLLQHPIPILTPAQKAAAEALKNKPPTLHLTKAERKRHRKLRRAERLREQQDMQAAGLVPPPEPRLTLSNYMKVLGDQAILDPSKMEAKVMEQVNQRKLKHERMNEERKLTKEQKAAKHARKLAEDTSTSVNVALFWVKDMSHPYHRAKVDLNAQQNSITGGVLECDQPGRGEDDKLVLVVAEGGEKAIKRYIRLMTVRMKWKGEDFYEEEEDDEELMVGEDEDGEENSKEKRKKFNPNNECELIWTGMAVKRAFHTFMFQSAQNPTVARKILEAKGVAHYWDLCMGLVERKEGGGEDGMRFRLGDVDEDAMSD
jgi:U4/U6 small nuclear ribonucleoprotein PRP3